LCVLMCACGCADRHSDRQRARQKRNERDESVQRRSAKSEEKNLLFQGGHLSGAALECLVDELLFIITYIPTNKE